MPQKPNDNMVIWNQVDKTDPDVTKEVPKGGFKLTAIDAYSQIKRATELFGPYGAAWGIRNHKISEFTAGLATLEAEFFYSMDGIKGSFPVAIGMPIFVKRGDTEMIDVDFPKKLLTSAISKSLSMLGFNADVFMGEFDESPGGDAPKRDQPTGGQPKVSKEFPSKFGTEEKPAKCDFCGKRHVLEGMPMVFRGEGDDRQCGAKECLRKKAELNTEAPGHPALRERAAKWTENQLWAALLRGEQDICGNDEEEIAELRESFLKVHEFKEAARETLVEYLLYLVELAHKKNAGGGNG